MRITRKPGGSFIKDVIHGGMDGTITTFAIVSGVAGAALGPSVTLILGLGNLFAHGFAQAVSDYFGIQAEEEYTDNVRKEVSHDLLSHFKQTENELEKYYAKHHYSKEDAEKIVLTLAKHKKVLADTVLDEELHLPRIQESPAKSGIATFASFVFFGFVPLFSYVMQIVLGQFRFDTFILAGALTAAVLFGLGTFKAAVTDEHWLSSGLKSLLLGGAAASIAFLVGTTIAHI